MIVADEESLVVGAMLGGHARDEFLGRDAFGCALIITGVPWVSSAHT